MFALLQFTYSQTHLDTATKYLYVREIKPNRSPEIDLWNKSNGSPLGSSYCHNFGQYCLRQAKAKNPIVKSGLAQSSWYAGKIKFSASDVIAKQKFVKKGDCIVWRKGLTNFGHFGFAYKDWNYITGQTIEANTSGNVAGSQDNGDGVYLKIRKISPYGYFKIRGFIKVQY